jgi:hypothetical protein
VGFWDELAEELSRREILMSLNRPPTEEIYAFVSLEFAGRVRAVSDAAISAAIGEITETDRVGRVLECLNWLYEHQADRAAAESEVPVVHSARGGSRINPGGVLASFWGGTSSLAMARGHSRALGKKQRPLAPSVLPGRPSPQRPLDCFPGGGGATDMDQGDCSTHSIRHRPGLLAG